MITLHAEKQADIRALSWTIRKEVGINLGGYNETKGVKQAGGISCSINRGLTLRLPDSLTPSEIERIESIVEAHSSSSPLPADFPPDAVPEPTVEEMRRHRISELRVKGVDRTVAEGVEMLNLLVDEMGLE